MIKDQSPVSELNQEIFILVQKWLFLHESASFTLLPAKYKNVDFFSFFEKNDDKTVRF